jgi:hypothetical protein
VDTLGEEVQYKGIFSKVIVENVSNLEKEMFLYLGIGGFLRTANRQNQKRTSPRLLLKHYA